jgi:monoamine oxidase
VRSRPKLRRRGEVVVVGAGAAGLAAAGDLLDAGFDPIILEARDRVGGRVFTQHAADAVVPIELGAEFIHGSAATIFDLARKHGLRVVDIADCRYQKLAKRLAPARDFWRRLDRVLGRLDAGRTNDRSFAEMLAANERSLSRRDVDVARQFVEGFDAADTTRISERWLADAGAPGDDPREMRIGRLVDGYGVLLEVFADRVRDRIRLGSVVAKIRWKRRRVEVSCVDASGAPLESVSAGAALVTVPIGVLNAPPGVTGAIEFDPPLGPARRAIEQLEMGHIIRLVLQFDQPFWLTEDFGEKVGHVGFDRVAFLQGKFSLPFSVWWTPYPVRAPILVAWAGGPRTIEMSRHRPQDLERLALESLAEILPMTVAQLRARFVASYHHDWINDPFTRGAYAYAIVGGFRAAERLARPVDDTIWFAGEVLGPEGSSGTVHAAIDSGRRAAKMITSR